MAQTAHGSSAHCCQAHSRLGRPTSLDFDRLVDDLSGLGPHGFVARLVYGLRCQLKAHCYCWLNLGLTVGHLEPDTEQLKFPLSLDWSTC